MGKTFNVTVEATVVAKEFKPATEACEKDGKRKLACQFYGI